MTGLMRKLRRLPYLLRVLCVITVLVIVKTVFPGVNWTETTIRIRILDFNKELDDFMVVPGNADNQQISQNSPLQTQHLLPANVQIHQHFHGVQSEHPQPEPVASKQLQDSRLQMAARISQAEKYCKRKKSQFQANKTMSYQVCPLISKNHHSKLCPIAKIGSTFWTRFYRVLRDSLNSSFIDSPFSVPLSKVEESRCSKNIINLNNDKVVKVMFVREPFSRILSAYVDKLISPNPIFWAKWGKPSLTLDGVHPEKIHCGQNVTFRQFLQFVNRRLSSRDNHVIPMVTICDPCQERYDVIGNMETFPADLKYLMSLINVTFKGDVNLSRETKLDAILDSIQGPFSWMQSIRNCISTTEMGRRIWRKLQIRGLISHDISYPLGKRNLSAMTIEEFKKIAVKAHMNSKDTKKLSEQKKLALIEAFRTVSIDEIQAFVDSYKDDFEAFGYNSAPQSIFDRTAELSNTDVFDFHKPWTISALS